jgi:hypothetical protein
MQCIAGERTCLRCNPRAIKQTEYQDCQTLAILVTIDTSKTEQTCSQLNPPRFLARNPMGRETSERPLIQVGPDVAREGNLSRRSLLKAHSRSILWRR